MTTDTTPESASDDYPICEDECVTWGGHAENCRVPAAIRALEAKVREAKFHLDLQVNETARLVQVVNERGARLNELSADRDRLDRMLRNLLARIHRDGGHYMTQHGAEKAAEDADQLVAELFADRDRLAGEVERRDSALDELRDAYGHMASEVARLTSELAAARESEARWKFVEQRAFQVRPDGQTTYWKVMVGPSERCMSFRFGVDVAIDAARRAGGEG